jgi:hypothetical protein
MTAKGATTRFVSVGKKLSDTCQPASTNKSAPALGGAPASTTAAASSPATTKQGE